MVRINSFKTSARTKPSTHSILGCGLTSHTTPKRRLPPIWRGASGPLLNRPPGYRYRKICVTKPLPCSCTVLRCTCIRSTLISSPCTDHLLRAAPGSFWFSLLFRWLAHIDSILDYVFSAMESLLNKDRCTSKSTGRILGCVQICRMVHNLPPAAVLAPARQMSAFERSEAWPDKPVRH